MDDGFQASFASLTDPARVRRGLRHASEPASAHQALEQSWETAAIWLQSAPLTHIALIGSKVQGNDKARLALEDVKASALVKPSCWSHLSDVNQLIELVPIHTQLSCPFAQGRTVELSEEARRVLRTAFESHELA
jgi:hypothetical protein